MPSIAIDLHSALKLRDSGALCIDVRTVAEFAQEHIPGAVNIPILSNEERAEIGTLHRLQGAAAARQRGVELVSPRIPQLIAAVSAARTQPRQQVLVYCWRGGLRSLAMARFLELAGFPVRQLQGGYKAFRRHVLDFFAEGSWGRVLVLRGLTGVGKTRILQQLAAKGWPVLDLEGIACHRGSAFGALGLGEQPSQKHFEGLVWDALRHFPPGTWLLTEGESRNIGKVQQPLNLYRSLQTEQTLWLHADLDYRVEVILSDYPVTDAMQSAYQAPIRSLKRRLGTARVDAYLKLLAAREWRELTRLLMLEYYDPLYQHTHPSDALEVAIEPQEGLEERLRTAIATILAAPPLHPEEAA